MFGLSPWGFRFVVLIGYRKAAERIYNKIDDKAEFEGVAVGDGAAELGIPIVKISGFQSLRFLLSEPQPVVTIYPLPKGAGSCSEEVGVKALSVASQLWFKRLPGDEISFVRSSCLAGADLCSSVNIGSTE